MSLGQDGDRQFIICVGDWQGLCYTELQRRAVETTSQGGEKWLEIRKCPCSRLSERKKSLSSPLSRTGSTLKTCSEVALSGAGLGC